MNKTELVKALAERVGTTQAQTARFVDAFTAIVTEQMVDQGTVRLPGFGNFTAKLCKARQARNPATGAVLHVDAHYKPACTFAKNVKDAVR